MKSLQGVADIIRWHHEKLDGSGYPDGLQGNDIPLGAQIMAVVDVYDALSTARPYKEPFPLEKCQAILYEEADKGWWNREAIGILFEKVVPNMGNDSCCKK